MNIFAHVRYLSTRIVLVLVIFLTVGQNASAIIVIDFSPDTTNAPLGGTGSTTNFLPGQIIGDRFTLTQDTVLTGGSIFSNSTVGVAGNAVRFLVFADSSGTPSTTPVSGFDIMTTLDAVDTLFTTTNTTTNATSASPLTRKHATITPTLLLAGTYWFSMPGDGLDIFQGTTTSAGGYDDGGYRNGSINLVSTSVNGGDMFFQLEAVPEPSLLLLAVTGLGCFLLSRHRR